MRAAFEEYGRNACYPHAGGMVEDPDGDLLMVFDEDAGTPGASSAVMTPCWRLGSGRSLRKGPKSTKPQWPRPSGLRNPH